MTALTGARLMPTYERRPPGVAMGMKPPVWLKDGDVVEVILENVGRCVNKVEFETKAKAKL